MKIALAQISMWNRLKRQKEIPYLSTRRKEWYK